MPDWENYILSAFFFVCICAIFFLWKLRKKKKSAGSRQLFITETLELAKSQFEPFNIKLVAGEGPRPGFSGLPEAIGPDGLRLSVHGFMPENLSSSAADVFFRARKPEGQVFYAFSTVIKSIESGSENSIALLEMPEHLRVEKKRHFNRVKPDKKDIRVIGVWPVKPGKRLPKSTSEMGPALTHYKPGMDKETVQIENISGAGLALRFASPGPDDPLFDFPRGSQLLCLVVYVLDDSEKPVAFWCTGEVMSERKTDGPSQETIIGLEFTNWAVLEQASSEIHWSHSSPTRGARPMLQWTEKIEQSQGAKLTH